MLKTLPLKLIILTIFIQVVFYLTHNWTWNWHK